MSANASTNQIAFVHTFYAPFQQSPLYDEVESLYTVQKHTQMPKFIPKMGKVESNEQVSFFYEGFRENLYDLIETKKIEKDRFVFSDVFAFFNTIISGLAALQLHEFTIDFSKKDLFLTTNNVLKCTAIKKITGPNLDREIFEFGVTMLNICNLQSSNYFSQNYEKFLVDDEFFMQELKNEISQMETNFQDEIFLSEGMIKFEVFLKIIRSCLLKKKNQDFISLFSKILPSLPQNVLERVILFVGKGFFI